MIADATGGGTILRDDGQQSHIGKLDQGLGEGTLLS